MKLKLLKPHIHAGDEYEAGEILDIEDEQSAEWLIKEGVAERAEAEPAE